MDKVTRVLLATLCIAVGGAAFSATAMAQGTDECVGNTYCLPAPPATATERAETKRDVQEATGRRATFETQIGTGLVFELGSSLRRSGGGGSGGGAPSGLYPQGVLAVGCADGCTLRATVTLKLDGGGTLRLPAARATIGPGGVVTLKIRLTRKQLRQYRAAGGGTASFRISITDNFGTHTDTVSADVEPK